MNKYTILIALSLLLSSMHSHAALRVVTTTQDVAAIAMAIGGEQTKVQSLTPGTRDPHFATAKPSMIRKVYGADLLVVIGADMEIGWLPALLSSARNTQVQPGNIGHLDLSRHISLLGKINAPVSRAMGDVHANGNPHYWLNPRNGLLMAQAIAKRLSELDPDNISVYQSRLKIFEETVKTKLTIWQKALLPLKNQSVIAYHTSFIYLADAFGFHIIDEVEPKPGISPSAASLNALIANVKNNNVKLLITEPYYEQRSAKFIKRKTDLTIAVLPQSVGAFPNIKTYFDLFDNIVHALTRNGEK